jgi:site-specific DNA-cytosine methylase
MSEEHKRAISAANKGRVVSEETKRKIRETSTGRSQTPEHRLNIKIAMARKWAEKRGSDPDEAERRIRAAGLADAPKTPRKSLPGSEAHDTPVRASPASITRPPAGEARPPKPKIRLTAAEVAAGRLDPSRFEKPRPAGPAVIDCQCFAGGFTLGVTQAGFTLVHKAEAPGGFGMTMCQANRGLLGDWWDGQVADPAAWEPVRADGMVTNPPCSGFSVMSPSSFRGMGSTVNQCMRDSFGYARRVPGLKFVVMESVQSAYKIGLPLMRELAATFPGWHVTHVLQNNLSLGGCTTRRRYFLCVTEFPLGVESEPLRWVPTVEDAIGDLRTLEMSWGTQPYDAKPTWWSVRQRSLSGRVDGHVTPQVSEVNLERLESILTGPDAVDWPPNYVWDQVLKRFYEANGYLPEQYEYQSQGRETSHLSRAKVLIDNDFQMGGYAQTRHWPWDRPGLVITGHGPAQVWHPAGRHLTHRETARIMGFPDDWLIEPLRNDSQLGAMWGKGVSVDCGRWIGTWVLRSMEGNPGSIRGTQLPDGTDRVIDVSQDFKKVMSV